LAGAGAAVVVLPVTASHDERPAGQSKHLRPYLNELYLPAGQARHADAGIAADRKRPTVQLTHFPHPGATLLLLSAAAAAASLLPSSAAAAFGSLGTTVQVPAAQTSHDRHTPPPRAAKRPRAHAAHDAWPARGWTRPAGQGAQSQEAPLAW